MKAFVAALVAGLLLMTAAPSAVHAKLKIVTTAPEYADLGRQIGQDKVQVHSVMKGPENVHNVLAKPTEMVVLNQADLFVHGGLDTEPWRDNLLKGARNPRVMPGRPGNVDMSEGVELRDVPTGRIDRSHGDVHAYGNPHFQLNPVNAQRMAATLAKAMMEVDGANAEFYKENAKRLVSDLADVTREIRQQFQPYAGLKIITFHPAWDYLADAIPVQIAGTIEPQPMITPSPAQVRQLIDRMKREAVKVVVVETYSDQKLARYVAEQAGAQLVRLPDHVLGLPEVDSYQKLFRYNTQKLLEAAKAAGIQPQAPDAEGSDAR